MKKQSCLLIIFFLFSVICSVTVNAQYIFVVTDMYGNGIKGAKIVTANKEPAYTDENGEVKYFVRNGYVTVTADGFMKKTINVFGIKTGTEVTVSMARVAPETKPLIVHVKNRKGKPIEGAMITVLPGTSAETDASGNATTTHKQQPGEYITVTASAEGYKSQEKQVLTGNNRTNFGGFGSVKVAEDEVSFTLESSKGASATMPLIVEVLDSKNDKPINGASVTIKSTGNGSQSSATTVSAGEARFRINKGDQLRAMVKYKGYKEKWSDITADLTSGADNGERRFVVYLSKEKEDNDANWNGTFTDNYSTYNFSGSASAVSANWTYVVGDSKGTVALTSTQVKGNTATGTWRAQHQDNTKSGSRSGAFTITLNGDAITGQLVEDTPSWSYKAGYSAANVSSSMHKGAVWAININRKK